MHNIYVNMVVQYILNVKNIFTFYLFTYILLTGNLTRVGIIGLLLFSAIWKIVK